MSEVKVAVVTRQKLDRALAPLTAAITALQFASPTTTPGTGTALTPGIHFPIVSATPPPNPVLAGLQWRQMTTQSRAIDWVWDAERWLSSNRFAFTLSVGRSLSVLENFALSGHPSDHKILLEEMICSWHHAEVINATGTGGLNSSIDYWAAQILYLTGGGLAAWIPDKLVTGQGLTVAANANITQRSTLNLEVDLRYSLNNLPIGRLRGLHIQFAKVGATNGVNFQMRFPTISIPYRLIYTP